MGTFHAATAPDAVLLTHMQTLALSVPNSARRSHQRLEKLPASISRLTCLTRLAVAACSLETLRPGPYLRGLRELNLFANGLR